MSVILGLTSRVITLKTDKIAMSLKITRNHNLGVAEARKRVDSVADSLCDKYGLRSTWEGDALRFDGSGVHGKIAVADESIDVRVKLGFALSMMSSAIRTSIEDALDTYLL